MTFLQNSVVLIASTVTDELAVYVKREFHRLGYRSADFMRLPVDMSDGSRDLLLAFAWLVHSERIICKFSVNCTTLFDDDTASIYAVCCSVSVSCEMLITSASGRLRNTQRLFVYLSVVVLCE